MSLRMRIAFAMMCLVLLTTTILGISIFQLSRKTIEKNYQNAHIHNLQVSSKVMDIYLEEIIEEGRTLLENDSFINIMETEESITGYFSSRNQLEIDSILRDISSHNSLINGMLVVSNQGNWRFYGKGDVYSGYLNHYYTTDRLLDEEWVKIADEAKGKEVFYSKDILMGQVTNDYFSVVKNLINPKTQESFGYLVFRVDEKIWEEFFGKDNEGYTTNRYMVLLPDEISEQEHIVYFNGKADEEEKILDSYSNSLNSEYLFSSYLNKTTNWTIMNVITKEELESDGDYIKKILIGTILVMIFISMFTAFIISKRITKPLDVFAMSISEVALGNLRVETEFDDSEVGLIGNRFKSLVNNNLELRDRLLNLEIKEKEAQLLLLQSQINPHFLYNTLDALYFMAIIEQADDIAEMVQALSNIFKRSLNKGDKLIKLQDEIEHMEDYMKIQNFRFHDRFILHINADKKILNMKILTFILQPILENAVYHGLESKTEIGNIYFTAKCDTENIYLSIRDDGVGIEDMNVIERGYGIRNIKERIQLYYGEKYSINVISKLNTGTAVEIVIPVNENATIE